MPVEYLKETPSQTAGPYVHIGTMPAFAGLSMRTQETPHIMAASGAANAIRIEGLVWDGSGYPVKDAMLELWQADPAGAYHASGFTGWGRAAADGDTGEWYFETVKPGPTLWRDGQMQAPHVSLLIFARGINIHLHTRMYFPEDTDLLAHDPAMRRIEQPQRRQTLIATAKPGAVPTYRFDIRLQGDQETVFFDM